MSKKRLITLILSIGIFLSLAATVFAAGQPRRYKENSTVKGTISQSFYQVNAKTDVTVKRITVTGTLYEKGTFGTWQKVSSCSNTSAFKKHTKWFWKINTVLCCLNLSQLSHCRAIKSKQLPATEHQ